MIFLTFPNLQIPEEGNIFSINEGNIKSKIKKYLIMSNIVWLNPEGKRTHTGRFIGSLVADFTEI